MCEMPHKRPPLPTPLSISLCVGVAHVACLRCMCVCVFALEKHLTLPSRVAVEEETVRDKCQRLWC